MRVASKGSQSHPFESLLYVQSKKINDHMNYDINPSENTTIIKISKLIHRQQILFDDLLRDQESIVQIYFERRDVINLQIIDLNSEF